METQQGPHMRLVATGDLLLTQRLSRRQEPGFAEVVAAVRAADVSVTNLECQVFDGRGYPATESGGVWPWAGPWAGQELGWLGFQLVGLANNHMMDYGTGGLDATLESLASAGLAYAGAGSNLAEALRPAYWDSPVGRIAMIATTSTYPAHARAGSARSDFSGRPGVNSLRFEVSYGASSEELAVVRDLGRAYGLGGVPSQIPGEAQPTNENEAWFAGVHLHTGTVGEVRSAPSARDLAANIRAVREAARQADWVIVQVHSHEAHVDPDAPARFMTTFCRACIDAGAHVVVGHGPHRTRGIEMYRGWPILYSLGNFVMQNETMVALPDDVYAAFDLGPDATPADVFDARSDYDRRGFPTQPLFWQTVLPTLTLTREGLQQLSMLPVSLGRTRSRTKRGLPEIARGPEAEEILARVKLLSQSLGTELTLDQKGLHWISSTSG